MGSPLTEKGRSDDEGPQHVVALPPFYMSATEVTLDSFLAYLREVGPRDVEELVEIERWRRTIPAKPLDREAAAEGVSNGDVYSPTALVRVGIPYGSLGGDRACPVTGITWMNAVNYCRWLRAKTGKAYRLPTEAEWEYACRAGSTRAYSFGESAERLPSFAWFRANSDGGPQQVGLKRPNAWGLYDMHGNALEWCHDLYDPRAYAKCPDQGLAKEPHGPSQPTTPADSPTRQRPSFHVTRGGSYDDPPSALRSANRIPETAAWRACDPQVPHSRWWLPQMAVGFRVVVEAESEK
jgi:formylglycine-generating enzyme required for sulfatase activity